MGSASMPRSSDTYDGVDMGTLGPQSPQGPPSPTVFWPHRANPPELRIDVQDAIAGYMVKGKGVKAPAKGEPDMCLVVVM